MTHPLIGKTITAIYLASDKMAIKFDVDGGDPVVAKTDGDCCSHSWIENVENPAALIGSPVLSAENIPMPGGSSSDNDDDVIAYYGFAIATAKGNCVLDYRNKSNGYYGGSLWWSGSDDDYFYGGVYRQNKSTEEWEQIA